jgi:hypothetical protein
MKKVLTGSMSIILSFIFSSSNANAFHKVTEILPCGKLLICKDYNQVRNGNSVVEYKRHLPTSKSNE